MKAIVCHSFAPLGDLRLGEFPEPVAGPGEVVTDLLAPGVNYPDVLIVDEQVTITNEETAR